MSTHFSPKRHLWFRLAHLTAIAVVVLQAWFGVICPLTTLEMTAKCHGLVWAVAQLNLIDREPPASGTPCLGPIKLNQANEEDPMDTQVVSDPACLVLIEHDTVFG